MNLVIFGATGGTGREIIRQGIAAGHTVTAFVRDPSNLETLEGLRLVQGDAMIEEDVRRALTDQDAVVLTLGNPQISFARMLGARRTTARDVCETGTRNVLAALPPGSQIPIAVVSAFGVGDTKAQLPLAFKLFYWAALQEQMADKERQEALLKASNANFVLVQPVALTDKPAAGRWKESTTGELGASEVSRSDLAAFILRELVEQKYRRCTVTFSG